jgi:hypothetical protein
MLDDEEECEATFCRNPDCQYYDEAELIEWCILCDCVWPCGEDHELIATKFICPNCMFG